MSRSAAYSATVWPGAAVTASTTRVARSPAAAWSARAAPRRRAGARRERVERRGCSSADSDPAAEAFGSTPISAASCLSSSYSRTSGSSSAKPIRDALPNGTCLVNERHLTPYVAQTAVSGRRRGCAPCRPAARGPLGIRACLRSGGARRCEHARGPPSRLPRHRKRGVRELRRAIEDERVVAQDANAHDARGLLLLAQ